METLDVTAQEIEQVGLGVEFGLGIPARELVPFSLEHEGV